MRILIALVMLTGCDDSPGLQGFVVDAHRVDAHEPCPDVSGFSPEDWVDPGELARATADGIRGCLIDQRLIVEFNNRCEAGAAYTHQRYEVILDTCVDQPDPSGGGFSDCWDVWASGTCNEIADNKGGPAGAAGGCAGILPILRREGRLACP